MVHVLAAELVFIFGRSDLDASHSFQFMLQSFLLVNLFRFFICFFFSLTSLFVSRLLNLLQDKIPLFIEGELLSVSSVFLRQG